MRRNTWRVDSDTSLSGTGPLQAIDISYFLLTYFYRGRGRYLALIEELGHLRKSLSSALVMQMSPVQQSRTLRTALSLP